MAINQQISYPVLALLILVAITLAFALASVLRRLVVMEAPPLSYLPHLVLLLPIAVTTLTARGMPTLAKSITVLGGVVAIWLVAVWLSSQSQRWISRKSPQSRK
jgi:hypothetical protein